MSREVDMPKMTRAVPHLQNKQQLQQVPPACTAAMAALLLVAHVSHSAVQGVMQLAAAAGPCQQAQHIWQWVVQ